MDRMVLTEPGERARARAPEYCDEDYPPIDGGFQNRTYFRPLTSAAVLAAWRRAAREIRVGRSPADVGIHVHWPFCRERCAYCYCDARVARRQDDPDAVLRALLEELRYFAPALAGVTVSSVNICGGTPTQAGAAALDALLGEIARLFSVDIPAAARLEATEATLGDGVLGVLSRRGISRVDLGVDSLDEGVLAAVGRRQSVQGVERALRGLSEAGVDDDGVSLMFGLPGQTASSFLRDVAWVIRRRPRRVLLYGFDARPQTDFFRAGGRLGPERRREIALVLRAARRLFRGLYEIDDSSWRPASFLLGVGWSAMSRIFGSLWYQHPPLGSRAARAGVVPPFFGMESSLDEEMRGYVVRGLYRAGRAEADGFRRTFGRSMLSAAALRAGAREFASRGFGRIERDGIFSFRGGKAPSIARRLFYSPKVVRALAQSRPRGRAPETECLSYVRAVAR